MELIVLNTFPPTTDLPPNGPFTITSVKASPFWSVPTIVNCCSLESDFTKYLG